MLTISPEEYMTDRVIYKMAIYDRLGHRQKRFYHWISAIGIICSATVPAVINLDWGSDGTLLATILSLIVAILAAFEKLFHFREHWRNYDTMAANLRTEQLQYQTRAGAYKSNATMTDEEAFRLFVTRVESLIADERSETIRMRTTDPQAT